MAPGLSVVVPIDNVESYLKECLDSIAAQTFDDFECVMLDDGSTDGSAAIAKEYAAKARVRHCGPVGRHRSGPVKIQHGRRHSRLADDSSPPPT